MRKLTSNSVSLASALCCPSITASELSSLCSALSSPAVVRGTRLGGSVNSTEYTFNLGLFICVVILDAWLCCVSGGAAKEMSIGSNDVKLVDKAIEQKVREIFFRTDVLLIDRIVIHNK